MNKLKILMTAALLWYAGNSAAVDKPDEVQYLLRFIEQSGCEFERNGTVYNSIDARKHIQRKFDYVESYIDETEDFIKYAATESSMSGEKYQVNCNGKQQTSAQWLLNELGRYRNQQI